MRSQDLKIAQPQQQETAGDKVRRIADQLREETTLQIKATSRILGAAAKIAVNHDRLIDEVVDMVETDLNQQSLTSTPTIYTVEMLKKRFKTLAEAKAQLDVKATSWAGLVDKLNHPANRTKPKKQSDIGVSERLDRIESELTAIRSDINRILSFIEGLNDKSVG